MTVLASIGVPGRSTTGVIDFHQHLWPSELVELLEWRTRPPFIRGRVLTTAEGVFPFDPEAHELHRRLDELDRAGIEIAVVSLQPTLGVDLLPLTERTPLLDGFHRGITRLVAESGGRLRGLAAGELHDGLDGICVGASKLLDLPSLASTLTELDRSNGLLFVHPDQVAPTPPTVPGWWQPVVEYTAEMQAAFFAWLDGGPRRWPGLPVVFSLLAGGAPIQLERLASRGVEARSLPSESLYFETSSYGRRAIELCAATFGIGHVVYGSDLPVIQPDPARAALASFGEAARSAISGGNAARLLEGDARCAARQEQAVAGVAALVAS